MSKTAALAALARMMPILMLAALAACTTNVNIAPDYSRPFVEQRLEGGPGDKILIVSLSGFISDMPRQGLVATRPSAVQEVVSRLDKAAADPKIKAVVLKIDSPGGTVVASDVIYSELVRFKELTKRPVVAAMMGVAASGAYQASLAADHVVAHPSAITGSVGTIFIRPNVSGLMDKIGVSVEVSKSGIDKDMGSPFRPETPHEARLLQGLIDDMNSRFLALVKKRRGLDETAMADVATARVYTAAQAVEIGLVDSLGGLRRALEQARTMAGLEDDCGVVVYRRTEYAHDTMYNTQAAWDGKSPLAGPVLDVQGLLPLRRTGFYRLWVPEYDNPAD